MLLIATVVGAQTDTRDAKLLWPAAVRRSSVTPTPREATTGWCGRPCWHSEPDGRWPISRCLTQVYAADGQGGHAFTYQVDRAQQAHPRGHRDSRRRRRRGICRHRRRRRGSPSTRSTKSSSAASGRSSSARPGTRRRSRCQSTQLSDEIRKVADDAGVPYLDALDPPWLTPDQMQPDLSGPTDEGQSVIADKVAAWLRTELAVR